MIHAVDIPQFTGNLEQLEADAQAFTTMAGKIRKTGHAVHTGFQGLSAFYHAPEAEELFATTAPVRDTADAFAGELESISSALDTYAAEIRPIVHKLGTLLTQASLFEASVEGDDGWQKDKKKHEEHQRIWHATNAAVSAFQAAERRAANSIAKLHGGTMLVADDGSGKPNAYGWGEEDLNNSEELPWGKPEQRKYPLFSLHTVKSFVWDGVLVGGVWGTVNGLLTLAGFHGWKEARQAWKGLAQLGTGIAIYMTPGLRDIPDDMLPAWMRDSKLVTREVGKSLVAWDDWKKDKGRAAGLAFFNIITIAAAPSKAGAVANATSKAAKAATALRVAGRVIDPMTYLTKAVGKAGGLARVKISDMLAGLKTVYAGHYAELADGALRFPDNTVIHPNGTVELPNGQMWDAEGNLLDENGQILQPAHDVPQELPAHERVHGEEDALELEHELAGVGGRGDHLNATNQADGSGTAGRDTSGHAAEHRDTAERTRLPSQPTHHSGESGTAHGNSASAGDDSPRRRHPESPIHDGEHGRGSGRTGDDATDNAVLEQGKDGDPGSVDEDSSVISQKPWSSGEGQAMVRGGETEQAVREGVKGIPGKLRPKPQVLERVMDRLASEPDGQRVAEIIASGRFNQSDQYGQVVSSLGANKTQMFQPSADQLIFADDLVRSGVPAHAIDFEQKIPVGADMDIRIRDDSGEVYAYQMKHLDDPQDPIAEITRGKYLLQLARAEANHHVLLVDGGRGTVGDWVSNGSYDALMNINRGASGPKGEGITFVVRLADGNLVVPPGSKLDPKDML
ncbi:hypothetical protein [Streptomyces palmae]|uniref:Uncharacterized protein n=1 Tax=Streptomyces palmae TaxID=1701085 RepID=A0A4Z0HAF5_9ACTN|nr:hypothetical protein [Streptomyces palmae]TGB11232.1 hypothetical protein E4099_12120 [Streptomyces palmae]